MHQTLDEVFGLAPSQKKSPSPSERGFTSTKLLNKVELDLIDL